MTAEFGRLSREIEAGVKEVFDGGSSARLWVATRERERLLLSRAKPEALEQNKVCWCSGSSVGLSARRKGFDSPTDRQNENEDMMKVVKRKFFGQEYTQYKNPEDLWDGFIIGMSITVLVFCMLLAYVYSV